MMDVCRYTCSALLGKFNLNTFCRPSGAEECVVDTGEKANAITERTTCPILPRLASQSHPDCQVKCYAVCTIHCSRPEELNFVLGQSTPLATAEGSSLRFDRALEEQGLFFLQIRDGDDGATPPRRVSDTKRRWRLVEFSPA